MFLPQKIKLKFCFFIVFCKFTHLQYGSFHKPRVRKCLLLFVPYCCCFLLNNPQAEGLSLHSFWALFALVFLTLPGLPREPESSMSLLNLVLIPDPKILQKETYSEKKEVGIHRRNGGRNKGGTRGGKK